MQVKTGRGTISMIVVLAIWSLSLGINLPGLAVTPIEGSLRSIFTDATDFKIQLLTMLPNLVIIPFVLLSGKLSESKYKIQVIAFGTILFLVAGFLSFLSSSLNMLIFMSCLLGAGCGLVLPFSTGLVADVFTGKYRMKQMGIVSAIGNISLVAATFAVGFLVAGNLSHTWHRAFFVYLIPVISLLLIPFLKKIPKTDLAVDGGRNENDATAAQPAAPAGGSDTDADGFRTAGQKIKGGFYVGRTVWLILAYFFYIFVNSVPSYYLPNLKWMSSEDASSIISIFYLGMSVVGMFLTPVMKFLRKSTFVVSAVLVVVGLALYVFVRGSLPVYIIAATLCGFGTGIIQPMFYTKATEIVTTPVKSTLALAFLQVANYIAISLVPVIIDGAAKLFHAPSPIFPFVFSLIAAAIVLVIVVIRRHHFVFGMSKTYL